MTWEFKQFQPPAARGDFDPGLYKNGDWYAEEKLDGDRRIAQFCDDAVRFTGRKLSEKSGLFVEKTDNVPHLNGRPHVLPGKKIPYTPFPTALAGTVLDGEMISATPGARSKDVTSIMGSLPDKAIDKQLERGWLKYMVFDCLFYKGEDLRGQMLLRRRRYLRKVLEEWGNPYAKLVTSNTTNTETPEDLLARVLRAGGEGIILKDLRSTYGNEKAWVKVKREVTEDVVIIGYDAPAEETEKTESYVDENGIKKKRVLEVSKSRLAEAGWIGAIRFAQYQAVAPGFENVTRLFYTPPLVDSYVKDGVKYVLTYCGSCSGMDDSVRADISANKDKYLGRVVEILANDREFTGKFRHPRMIEFRDNKNASDCIWERK
jgi:hypothetical protein